VTSARKKDRNKGLVRRYRMRVNLPAKLSDTQGEMLVAKETKKLLRICKRMQEKPDRSSQNIAQLIYLTSTRTRFLRYRGSSIICSEDEIGWQ